MRMRKVARAAFNNPGIKDDPMFAFNPQLAVDKFFNNQWLAMQRAKAAAAKAAAAK